MLMTFGVQSTLIHFTVSHPQLLQTSQFSANMLLMSCGKQKPTEPFISPDHARKPWSTHFSIEFTSRHKSYLNQQTNR